MTSCLARIADVFGRRPRIIDAFFILLAVGLASQSSSTSSSLLAALPWSASSSPATLLTAEEATTKLVDTMTQRLHALVGKKYCEERVAVVSFREALKSPPTFEDRYTEIDMPQMSMNFDLRAEEVASWTGMRPTQGAVVAIVAEALERLDEELQGRDIVELTMGPSFSTACRVHMAALQHARYIVGVFAAIFVFFLAAVVQFFCCDVPAKSVKKTTPTPAAATTTSKTTAKASSADDGDDDEDADDSGEYEYEYEDDEDDEDEDATATK